MPFKDVYGLKGDGTKIYMGTKYVPPVLQPVGGRIFYIDPNSDRQVSFYDSNRDPISSVSVGDIPAYYAIESEGSSGKDKYYVYQEENYTSKVWTYKDNGSWVYESTGYTSQDIGAGKINTAGITALHDGAYIIDNTHRTIWYAINQCRLTQLGGCSDWFVGSKTELETLRSFINDNISTLGLVDLFTSQHVWSSSENSSSAAMGWYESSWQNYTKATDLGVIPLRSF